MAKAAEKNTRKFDAEKKRRDEFADWAKRAIRCGVGSWTKPTAMRSSDPARDNWTMDLSSHRLGKRDGVDFELPLATFPRLATASVDDQTFKGARLLQEMYERANPLFRLAEALGRPGPADYTPLPRTYEDTPAAQELAPKKRGHRQTERAEKALDKLYPRGTDLHTEALRAAVAIELGPESKTRGWANPSWDTIDRIQKKRGWK
jgi:hypothetical protein